MSLASIIKDKAVEPLREIAAYEALWQDRSASFKKLSELFAKNPGKLPSDLVNDLMIGDLPLLMKKLLLSLNLKPNILINGTFDYPTKLKDALEPVEILYYSGNLDLLSTRSVAIVGSRVPSENGLKRTKKLTELFVKDNFTIVSGLAKGVDTMAHKTAISCKGKTIAVIGTPLNHVYPKENAGLQSQIASEHLLVSQVPFCRYDQQTFHGNRLFFPERNKTMSALTEATVIVEASETSGTLIQAQAAINQGRKLFILDSCFQREDLRWPKKFEAQGAVRVKEYADIKRHLLID